ncbi:nitronate monooxygenase family protein [Mycobacterium ulcerans str. Harvey]|uniref:Nitronate monooxygenase family protein n=1 Tax=Mycobacterium ulcerans str. Harvey TaxID=1299332 RepID=A0ABP3AGF0_MYCUL|nr:nitronate monooxygenase family protein [Mycobacterium ulcerans str. Harvey]
MAAAPVGAGAGQRVGCGFITWSLARNPELLDLILAANPAAIMLSFGDPHNFAGPIHDAGIPLICQIHTREQALRVLEVGPDIIVAQGSESGGHGMSVRSTFTLVPDVVDLVAQRSAETLVVAAGGSPMAAGWQQRWRWAQTAPWWVPDSGLAQRRWYRREPTSGRWRPAGTTPSVPASTTLCGSGIGRRNTIFGCSATR